jgi:hypothetical protein
MVMRIHMPLIMNNSINIMYIGIIMTNNYLILIYNLEINH